MTLELAKFLMAATENAGSEARIMEDYSGRGMMGKTTVGIVVDSVPLLLADVLEYVSQNISDFCDDNVTLKVWDGLAIPDIHSFRVDNMANQTILY